MKKGTTAKEFVKKQLPTGHNGMFKVDIGKYSLSTIRKAINSLVELQAQSGGNALIGRQLFPLLQKAGFEKPQVSPRLVYADSSRPRMVEGFTKNTFTAMIEGVRDRVLAAKLIEEEIFDRGIRDLYETAGPTGVFCYTFFKAVAQKTRE